MNCASVTYYRNIIYFIKNTIVEIYYIYNKCFILGFITLGQYTMVNAN